VDAPSLTDSVRASVLGGPHRQHRENGALRSLQRGSAGGEISPLQSSNRNAPDLNRQQSPLSRATAPKVGRIALPIYRQRDAVKRLRCFFRPHATPRLLPPRMSAFPVQTTTVANEIEPSWSQHMTQQHISPPEPLTDCAADHSARHPHDLRCLTAGGGHESPQRVGTGGGHGRR